jgi:hypothetical protein
MPQISNTTYPQGSHTADGGRAGRQFSSYYGAPGAPLSPWFIYDFVPRPASLLNVAPEQVAPNGGYLTLVNSGNSGTNTVVTLDNGQMAVEFDCARAIQITGVAGVTASTFYIYGMSEGINVTEQLAGPVGATAVTSKKTYDKILRIWTSASSTNNISIGCADVFGLPYVSYDSNYINAIWKGREDYNVTYPVLKGTATLVGGTIPVTTTAVKSNSLIVICRNLPGGTTGELGVPQASIVNGTSFVINSYQANGTLQTLDTSQVTWYILEPTYFSGTATLGSVGTVFVDNVNAKEDSVIITCRNTPNGTTIGALDLGAVIDGVGFTIDSQAAADRSTVNYWILDPSLYTGTVQLDPDGPPSTVTVENAYVTSASSIIVSRKTMTTGTAGILYASTASITDNTSFVISSGGSATDDSDVNYTIINAPTAGVFTLADRTDPATITSGDTRGKYSPSSPSDGASTLTLYMYNRAVDNVAYLKGIELSDPYLAQTDANLHGVLQYSDVNH